MLVITHTHTQYIYVFHNSLHTETAVEDKTLEDSSDSHFESLWIQPQIPPHKSASRAASLPPSFINAVEEKKINPTELYLPVLPDRNPQQRAVPPPVSPR